MSDKFQLDDHGNCPACSNLSKGEEHVKCFFCIKLFHVVCPVAKADEKVATKTAIFHMLQASTKNNFLFLCDKCLTSLEINRGAEDSQRISLLESKMNTFSKQLTEICSMLKSNTGNSSDTQPKSKPRTVKDSIWNDSEKLSRVKAPPPPAALVVPKIPDQRTHVANQTIIEKTIVENQIPLKETYTNKSGDLVIVCESTEKRDELKNLVQTAKRDINMTSPKVKHQSITIVGMAREYSTEEIKNLILQQNMLIKRFAEANNFDEHFRIHSVKPLKNNPEKFQVFASVSECLREGFRRAKDKLLMGVNTCKIYDRRQTKRCNNCQKFGHFVANCPTPNEASCGKCSESHSSNDCTSTERGCINCRRNNLEYNSHSAFYHKCPMLVKYQEESEPTNLNSVRQRQNVHQLDV